jgi:hypothetical protein
MALGFTYELLHITVESMVLVLNIYFKRFILRKFKVILANSQAEFWGIKKALNSSYGVGEYDKFIVRFSNESLSFINASIYPPIFSIIIITLLYNCSYYIVCNKQPYIPILTSMVDKLKPNDPKD